MKITVAVPAYPTATVPPPPVSRVGSWVSTHECLAHLAAAGHNVTVVLRNTPNGAEYRLDGVRVVPRGDFGRLATGADIVISHIGVDDTAARWARRRHIPSVRFAHGSWIDWTTDLFADLLIFNSQSMADEAHDGGWSGPHLVIRPPVYAEDFRCEPGDRVLLGNVSADKGAATFWAAAAALPDVPFLGVMATYSSTIGPDGKPLRRPKDCPLPNVELIRPVNRMRDVYERTAVVLMPSVRESYGRIGVEAACAGIPTIAHPTPGLLEALPGAVFLDRDDHPAWIDAIARLVRDEEAWAAASAATAATVDLLHPDAELDRLVADLEALAQGPSR